MNRREFLKGTAGMSLFAALPGCANLWAPSQAADGVALRFGMVTDIHYADRESDKVARGVSGKRYFRESLIKLDEAVRVFNEREVDFAIELGDFKDFTRKKKAKTLDYLKDVEGVFAKFDGPRYHVCGNHDFDGMTPAVFFAHTPNDGEVMDKGYYSFEKNGITCIVLDACYDSKGKHYSGWSEWHDTNIPADQVAWLERELASAKGHVLVFCHQRLDDRAAAQHNVKNAAQIRALLEKSGKVKGVFTGHQHNGGIRELNGILYYSLRALVCGTAAEGGSYAEATIYRDGKIAIQGWRDAVSWGEVKCG